MIRTAKLILCLAVLLSFAVGSKASTSIAIDGLHGLPELLDYQIDLETLYPEYDFVQFNNERIPLTNPIHYGLTRGNWEPSTIVIELTEEVDALYLILDISYIPGQIDQLPFISVIAPDQSLSTGAYGKWHSDSPLPGTYEFTITSGLEQMRFRIGTGPALWEVYPPEDYSSVLYLNGFTWQFFRGLPALHSGSDLNRLQNYLDNDGSYGLIYEPNEPVAMKPIIQVRDFDASLDLALDVPGRLTYRTPQVVSEKPVRWNLGRQDDMEILYEAAFERPLNFVSYSAETDRVSNHSWATVHDLMLLEFLPAVGYRFIEFGTILPGGTQKQSASSSLSASETEAFLQRILQAEAIGAGMTEEESRTFFSHRYNWIPRLLADVSANPAPVCLYRIEDSDYDGLIPISISPYPADLVRVMWVYSVLPDNADVIAPVHPIASAQTNRRPAESRGSIHEYGFFREYYGGDALDELEEWNWHCYDRSLTDTTNFVEWPQQIEFHTAGASPLAVSLLEQVQIVEGEFSSAIEPLAGPNEVVLCGDEDTYCQDPGTPFPTGSFPPVVVARDEVQGGRLIAYSDLHFFADKADNLQFNLNVFDWLSGGPQDPIPDIDIADAVVETLLVDDQTAATSLTVLNRGEAALTLNSAVPEVPWIEVLGPTDTTLEAGNSFDFQILWNSAGLNEGFHSVNWSFTTNDPNEAELQWPIILQVVRTSATRSETSQPESFRLNSAYPNPFNAEVNVSFTVEYESVIDFTLINILGQRVQEISGMAWAPGAHELSFDFSDKPSGLYYLGASTNTSQQLIKLVHLK